MYKESAHVIALAIGGQLWSSEELAAELDRPGTYGSSHVAFVIGGSHGLSAAPRLAEAQLRAHDALPTTPLSA
ncbi:23S rRNA (pseudouridine(1915)-N(3))-methyltransferase RlmH [Paenibacillus thiaminolyticus]|nr:23S rRNA (pseudouridine(1915)-N(3))-methyltransferase RlmH [Paenibacillus thiaminolyticus]WCF08313.1 23S rRNA (pseudouridine(1915)-N(3))-methyltransferase RlmH [Paenibacillus thiaminolyticus]